MRTLFTVIATTTLMALGVIFASTAAAGEDSPRNNRSGCCFTFDDSPVTVVFCMTEKACQIGAPK